MRVAQAASERKVLCYVGLIKDGCCLVKMVAVDEHNPLLYKVKNGENALAFYIRLLSINSISTKRLWCR